MEENEQLNLDEDLYEFKDSTVLNFVDKIENQADKIKNHNMLAPEDFQQMMTLTDDLSDMVSELFDYLLLTKTREMGG